jgi:hypothetical protein
MIYSYTQIAQFLSCPRRNLYRYLDGWLEKDTHASLLFGRAFETALAAYFRRFDSEAVLYREWRQFREMRLDFPRGESWDRMLQEGVVLLQHFAQQNRVQIAEPERCLQVKIARDLPAGNEFLGYVDAIGQVDGQECLIDWKTASSCYPQEPEGILALDPQLVCYSWLTGLAHVALVVFVRKRTPEIQYLRTTITDDQRNEFAELVDDTVRQIESSRFLPHSGIRFPMNACTSCRYLGLCLKQQPLIDASLIRRPGASELDWIDELRD